MAPMIWHVSCAVLLFYTVVFRGKHLQEDIAWNCFILCFLTICCILDICCVFSCTWYTSIAGWRVQHCLWQNLPGTRPLLIIQIQESKLMSKSTSSIWWMRWQSENPRGPSQDQGRIQHCLCIISDQVNINSTALCFNFQFVSRHMKRFYWCRRITWHYWALSSHLQSIALNQTCTTKTMGKLASKTQFPVLSCVFCALQIGFRALRFDFVKGYSARFQAVLNWDRAMYKGGMSLCALANMPRTSTYNIYIFPFSSIMLAVRLEF